MFETLRAAENIAQTKTSHKTDANVIQSPNPLLDTVIPQTLYKVRMNP